MRSSLTAAILLSVSSVAACAHVTGPTSPRNWNHEIMAAEAVRDAGSPAIRAALKSSDPEARSLALWALGRIEEVGTATLAAPFLMDKNANVANRAAFALGQINGTSARRALKHALPFSLAPRAILRALSRCGSPSAALTISSFLVHEDPVLRGEAALSLGLLKKRLPKVSDDYAKSLGPLIRDPAPEVRFGAAYALARFPSPEAAVQLIFGLSDKDPEVRMWSVIGLGKSGSDPSVFDAVMRDPDWRVRAAAASALGVGAGANESAASRAVRRLDTLASVAFERVAKGQPLLSGRAMHVLRAAITGAEAAGKPGRAVLEQLERATWETKNLPTAATQDLAQVQCAAAAALDRLDGTSKRIQTCGRGVFMEWRRKVLWLELRAKQGGKDAVSDILPFTLNADPKLRTAAVVALAEIMTAEATDALLSRLDSNDLLVASSALEMLSRKDRTKLRPPALAERLLDTLQRLLAQPDDSLIVGALDAIALLGNDAMPLLGRMRELSRDPRPAVRRRAAAVREKLTGKPQPFGPNPRGPMVQPPALRFGQTELVLETVRGTVVMGLDGDRAPRFAGVLAFLAERGDYNGLTFHRVVSGFVAQGGCPRGDGWGGPGYTVAGETSPQPFSRGAIGIATNGRDTGGSQFFFMHAYHPHLDGGYPWVGRVIEGIDVVDALQPDDRILRAFVR